jgi:hypothetical protein
VLGRWYERAIVDRTRRSLACASRRTGPHARRGHADGAEPDRGERSTPTDPAIRSDSALLGAPREHPPRRASLGPGRLPARRYRAPASARHDGRGTPGLQRLHGAIGLARGRGLAAAVCHRIYRCDRPRGGIPGERPVSRVLSWADVAIGHGRPSICATYPGAERATCCGRSRLALPYSVLLRLELAAFHSRRRTGGHRHCGAIPRLTADGRYPLACSEELGLSSDAAFRPMRPRPSGRLQGETVYPTRTPVRLTGTGPMRSRPRNETDARCERAPTRRRPAASRT